MKLPRMMLISVMFGLLAAGGAAAYDGPDADKAALEFAKGTDLLHRGDFSGALDAYAAASQLDEEKTEYRQKYMVLRKVVSLREGLAAEQDPEQWTKTAATLKNFYYSNRLYADLLALARQMHEKKQSVGSATLLADALLNMEEDAEVVELLASQPQADLTPQAKVLLGIGLGRQKKLDEAGAILEQVVLPEPASPRLLCDVARLEVLCGKVDDAMVRLTSAFESTSPRGITAFREFVVNLPEFKALPANANFETVLATESKVAESSCSSGADCGSCPSKGGCSSEKDDGCADDKKDADG
ncbi:MAG: hypothetical protein HY812_03505 [Planctomycetes bacterium]|nr:hypothetical protein [Planctomycetota bacterium]